ncbi:MAG: type I DNA topoisomerase [Patescibacteria group bacterium]|nr:type I DNA topoisomerase [Patescibacteria group bacterium]
MKLIIVESPTKSKTIQKFLGSEYKVLSSYGHIRDLPKSELGIDTENNFAVKYIIPMKARKIANLLKKESKKSDEIILAADEDREGEAIAWHIAQILNSDNSKPHKRIVFHEITKQAIEQALKNPREIKMNLVDAQQARRILDRLVGYKLSPFLWKKVVKGLSAGRVQSVTVKLIVAREREIEKFEKQEYHTIEAKLKKSANNDNIEITAFLFKKNEKTIQKLDIKTKQQADAIIKDLNNAEYKITSIEKKQVKRNPFPPLKTTSLQQEAWKKFHFPAKFTMGIAQNLYEKGYITYHRTDSLNLSEQSLTSAHKFILKNFGKNYATETPRRFKTKSKGAQEAHEAIRPAYPDKKPEDLNLDDKQFKLYNLIWRRFIASQMTSAIFETNSVKISADCSKNNYVFKTTGQILKFDGFLKIYPVKFEENELPVLSENEILKLIKLTSNQHFTQPPARYNEASLIKVLEENGIGRPSTYAPTISTIQTRNYIIKNDSRKFEPTEIGVIVNDLLEKHFPKIVDIKFTAKMEEKLDQIAENKIKWKKVIKDFYEPFSENLEKKYKEISKQKIAEQETQEICPKCGAKLIIKLGRFGKFYACPNFPKCRHTAPLKSASLGIKCPKCDKGEIIEKKTKKGKIFYSCNQYPKCDFALWDKPINKKCPKCDSLLIETKKGAIKCSNKECDYKD